MNVGVESWPRQIQGDVDQYSHCIFGGWTLKNLAGLNFESAASVIFPQQVSGWLCNEGMWNGWTTDEDPPPPPPQLVSRFLLEF